jgi:aspartate aminotransferase
MADTQKLKSPVFSIPESYLIPVDNYLKKLVPIPPSRMFLINKSLKIFKDKNSDKEVFDASQGDGGASLKGVPDEVLEKAARMQIDQGTSYNMPFGTASFRKTVIEEYWKLDSSCGITPTNVLATAGGRDALVKIYQAMLALGRGRQGDVLLVSRVPWISYNWGPYCVGANVIWAPGDEERGWVYSEEAIQESINFARNSGREIAGLVITCPDNPTGLTIAPQRQIELAKAALRMGVAFVLFDWMYHYVTDDKPMDLNSFIKEFDMEERERLIFLDGITKSLGASNIRNCHVIASEEVIEFITARASHTVMPSFFSMAVAIAAYEMGYEKATRLIVGPTNESRVVLKNHLDTKGYRYILGKGYYAFVHVGAWLEKANWNDSEPMGQYLAEKFGLAVVPGAFFSPYGGNWIRFSYATPPERTMGALERMDQALAWSHDV